MERRIDVNRGHNSAVDNDFTNMRDRFEQEMRRVEDEMHRLREEFEGTHLLTDIIFARFLYAGCCSFSCMRIAVKYTWSISWSGKQLHIKEHLKNDSDRWEVD